MKKAVYILLFLNISLIALSPRILIKISPKSSLSIQDLTNNMDAHVIQGESDQALEEQINALDKASENHRIVIDGLVENLTRLALQCGYDFIELHENDTSSAYEAIEAKEKKIPVTDDALPHIDAKTAGLLYDLMMKVDALLNEYNLTYWATNGTMLGALRHKGLVPWDDDLDICMYMHDMPKLLSLRDVFKAHGIAITGHRHGWYKAYFIDGKKVEIVDMYKKKYNYQNYFEWTFPSLDIFPVHLDAQNRIHYANQKARDIWPNEYFLPHELIPPFILLPFGPMNIPVPRNMEDILTRMYGDDWNTVAYCSYNHQHEDVVQKIKVALTNRSPIPYIMPVR